MNYTGKAVTACKTWDKSPGLELFGGFTNERYLTTRRSATERLIVIYFSYALQVVNFAVFSIQVFDVRFRRDLAASGF